MYSTVFKGVKWPHVLQHRGRRRRSGVSFALHIFLCSPGSWGGLGGEAGKGGDPWGGRGVLHHVIAVVNMPYMPVNVL